MNSRSPHQSIARRWTRPVQWALLSVLWLMLAFEVFGALLKPLVAVVGEPCDIGEPCSSMTVPLIYAVVVIISAVAAIMIMFRTRSMRVRLLVGLVAVIVSSPIGYL